MICRRATARRPGDMRGGGVREPVASASGPGRCGIRHVFAGLVVVLGFHGCAVSSMGTSCFT
eukprot:3989887-Lingulodinium_polyedra.AAC.1